MCPLRQERRRTHRVGQMMLSTINNSFEQDTHDVDGNCDGPDLDFVYADVDSY